MIYLRELDLGNVGLSVDSKHNGQCTIVCSRFAESLADELHVSVCLLGETESEQDVYGEARVSNPAVAIIPITRSC